MSEPERPKEKVPSQARQDRLKEIEALYRSQIKQIYSEGKDKPEEKKPIDSLIAKPDLNPNPRPAPANMQSPARVSKVLTHVKSATNIPLA